MSNKLSLDGSIFFGFALGFIVVMGQVDAKSIPADPTTICQMMQDPGTVSGRRVELRATVRSHKEWAALVSPTKCTNPLRTKGLVWPAAITYRWTSQKSATEGRQEIRQHFQQLGPGELLEATLTGIVSTKNREEYDSTRLQNGMWVPVNGFGHMNAYFAELAIESVRDIAVVRKEDDSKE